MSETPSNSKSTENGWESLTNRRFEIVVLLAMTVLVRVIVLVVFADNLQDDPDAYRALAAGIREDGIFGVKTDDGPTIPTAYRPPLYPIVLSCLVGFTKAFPWLVGALHVILGLWTVFNTYLLASTWGIRKRRWLPAIFVAVDPILLNQSTLIMTETLAAMMTTCCLLALLRWNRTPTTVHSLLVGATFGIAMLCRPTFVVWFALAGLASIASKFRDVNARPQLAIVLVTCCLVLTPWVIRNQITLYPPGHRSILESRPVFATTHGGYTLLLGNNDSFYDHLRSPESKGVWPAENVDFQNELRQTRTSALQQFQQDQDDTPPTDRFLETYRDRACYERAFEVIGNRPGEFATSCVVRVGWLWSPLTHQLGETESRSRRGMRYLIAGWYAIIYLAGGVGLLHWKEARQRAPALDTNSEGKAGQLHPWLYGLLFCVALTVLHMFFWSNMRMRAPLVPILSLMAAFGLNQMISILGSKRRFD